jgi:hydrogenase maturation protease
VTAADEVRLVIGVGNPDAGDDAAGRLVARRLAQRNGCAAGAPTPVLRECEGEATALMEAWTGFDDVAVVDACQDAGAPGRIHVVGPGDSGRLALLRPGGHASARRSSHGLGVAEAVALAGAIGTLPARLVIYAIEGRHFAAGNALSPEVDHAVDEVVALLVQWLSGGANHPSPAGET